jgi:hypothetical protein
MKIYSVPGTLVLVGIVLMELFASAPRYADPNWRSAVRGADSDAFVEEQSRNLTVESRLADAGSGLAALGATMALAFGLARLRRLHDLQTARTPGRSWPLFALAIVTPIAFVFEEVRWLEYTAARGDYPWWADSIAIGMYQEVVLGAAFMLVGNLGLAVCMWGARLPAEFWHAPRKPWARVVTVVAVLILLLVTDEMWSAIAEGRALAVPLLCSTSYLVLCGRAAAASAV